MSSTLPAETQPCRRCHQPHPHGPRGYEAWSTEHGWHAWTPPAAPTTSQPRLPAGMPAGWTPVLFGALARCGTCAALVDNRSPDIATHREWHEQMENR